MWRKGSILATVTALAWLPRGAQARQPSPAGLARAATDVSSPYHSHNSFIPPIPRFTLFAVLLISLFGCDSQPSVDSAASAEQHAALDRIHDETQLAEVALDNRDSYIASIAAGRLTDRVLLEKVAVFSAWSVARRRAFAALRSPSRLAQILQSEPVKAIPFVESQTDRAFLSEISRITEYGFNSGSYDYDDNGSIASKDDRDFEGDVYTWRNCGIIASLKLSLLDTTIVNRLGDLRLIIKRLGTQQGYSLYEKGSYSYLGSAGTIEGEQVTLLIERAAPSMHEAGALVKRTFNTHFPQGNTYLNQKPILFQGAELSTEPILSKLLHRNEFTSSDLFIIATTGAIADLRACAVFSINDEDSLTKIAKNDPAPQVRLAAVKRLQKQETLFEIAMNKQEKLRTRIVATLRVTNAALKKKLAERTSEPSIRVQCR